MSLRRKADGSVIFSCGCLRKAPCSGVSFSLKKWEVSLSD
nr:MAG TPA: hypothetical protein [Caudoviricetes sp.]